METTLYLFRLPRRSIPFALLQMALGRRKARKLPGVTFAKLLGTGTGKSFTPSDSDIEQWAILLVGDNLQELDSSRFISKWRQRSMSEERYCLRPISSHGYWSSRQPFAVESAERPQGPVVAITRARLRFSTALRFWRSIPPVVTDLHSAPGLISAFGIGEAPIGLQGTFSLWRDEASLKSFAYRGAAHQSAIADTEKFNWYSEELFARFELINKADFPHVH